MCYMNLVPDNGVAGKRVSRNKTAKFFTQKFLHNRLTTTRKSCRVQPTASTPTCLHKQKGITMSNTPAIRVSASPKAVRAWAESVGAIPAGQRGRLGADVIAAYNAKNGLKHTEKAFVKTLVVKAKPAKGRTVTKRVSVPDVRAAAKAAGINVGERGRIPQTVLSAYVLGTL